MLSMLSSVFKERLDLTDRLIRIGATPRRVTPVHIAPVTDYDPVSQNLAPRSAGPQPAERLIHCQAWARTYLGSLADHLCASIAAHASSQVAP